MDPTRTAPHVEDMESMWKAFGGETREETGRRGVKRRGVEKKRGETVLCTQTCVDAPADFPLLVRLLLKRSTAQLGWRALIMHVERFWSFVEKVELGGAPGPRAAPSPGGTARKR